MQQVDAVEARISLDLRIGAAFTRLTTMSLQNRVAGLAEKVISYGEQYLLQYADVAGPCQFPTLGFVVDQYKRVQAFVPEPFWYIAVSMTREGEEGEDSSEVSFTWRRGHLFDLPFAMLLYEQCVEHPTATVVKVETKPTSKWWAHYDQN